MHTATDALSVLPAEEYYLIFITILAYNEESFSKIITYGEFLESNCEFIIDTDDVCYVRIFTKDETIYERMLNILREDLETPESFSYEDDIDYEQPIIHDRLWSTSMD